MCMCQSSEVILPLEWGNPFKRLNPLGTFLTRTFWNWPLECKCWFLFSLTSLNLSSQMNWTILLDNLISERWLCERVMQCAGRVWTELLVLHFSCYNSSSDRNSPIPALGRPISVPRASWVATVASFILQILEGLFMSFLCYRKRYSCCLYDSEHQLKTIPCIIYLLGWISVSACVKSLY